jgi:hypothetical protein
VIEGSDQITKAAVWGRCFAGFDPGSTTDDAPSRLLKKLQLVLRKSEGERLDQLLLRYAEIDQSRHQHVAGDTVRGVDEECALTR